MRGCSITEGQQFGFVPPNRLQHVGREGLAALYGQVFAAPPEGNPLRMKCTDEGRDRDRGHSGLSHNSTSSASSSSPAKE